MKTKMIMLAAALIAALMTAGCAANGRIFTDKPTHRVIMMGKTPSISFNGK